MPSETSAKLAEGKENPPTATDVAMAVERKSRRLAVAVQAVLMRVLQLEWLNADAVDSVVRVMRGESTFIVEEKY